MTTVTHGKDKYGRDAISLHMHGDYVKDIPEAAKEYGRHVNIFVMGALDVAIETAKYIRPYYDLGYTLLFNWTEYQTSGNMRWNIAYLETNEFVKRDVSRIDLLIFLNDELDHLSQSKYEEIEHLEGDEFMEEYWKIENRTTEGDDVAERVMEMLQGDPRLEGFG